MYPASLFLILSGCFLCPGAFKKNYLCIRYVSVVYVVSVVFVHPITCREGAEGGVEV